jgi:hypothetical protein
MENYFVQSSLAKIAKMLTDKYGLTVKFAGNVPMTNGSEITLPAVSDELPKAEQEDLLAYVIHEVSHILFTNFKFSEDFTAKHGDKAFNLLNALEDARIEYLIEKEYVGAKTILDESIIRTTAKMELGATPDKFSQFGAMLYLIGRDYPIPSNWDSDVVNKANQFKTEITEAVNAKSTEEVAELVIKILEILKEEQENDNQNRDDSSSSDSESDTTDTNEHSSSVENKLDNSSSNLNIWHYYLLCLSLKNYYLVYSLHYWNIHLCL